MKTLIAMLLTVLVLSGCGGGLEKKVVGTWKVDSAKTVMTGEKTSEEEKKMMMTMMGTVTVDLKEDKTFEMKILLPITGKWSLADSKLTLTPELKPGETLTLPGNKKTMDFDVDGSGTSMSMKIDDPKMPGTLVMVKNPS